VRAAGEIALYSVKVLVLLLRQYGVSTFYHAPNFNKTGNVRTTQHGGRVRVTTVTVENK
jgi:hypothetical protein